MLTDASGGKVALRYPPSIAPSTNLVANAATVSSNGLNPDPNRRPGIKVEYYDETAGSWMQYSDLVNYQNHYVQTSHLVNINPFRSVTQVRWTYYDVPATAADGTSFKLEDVALTGVCRYQDIRQNHNAWTYLADSWTASNSLDVGYTHYHQESTSLDFFDEAGRFQMMPGVTHGVWRIKADSNGDCQYEVWRRVPVLRFQTQAFQSEALAMRSYDPDADQKTGYIPGERIWYKDTVYNVPRASSNLGTSRLEGEAYNPVFYERIPIDYLVDEEGKAVSAEWLKQRLEMGGHIRWTNAGGADVLKARTTDAGVKLQVTQIDPDTGRVVDTTDTTSYVPTEDYDYGGAMLYANSKKNVAASNVGKPFADPYSGKLKREDSFRAVPHRVGAHRTRSRQSQS